MPTYDVKCEACGAVFEAFQAMGAPAPACSSCGSEKTHLRPGRPSVRFVGPGFYETDYGKKAYDPKHPDKKSWRDDVKWNDEDSVS